MDGQIFISYRRDDSSSAAGRIYDRLDSHFSSNHIFMDVDNLDLGVDFVEAIEKSVGSCDVLIAVIGKHWLMSSDEEGRRRLDNPEDFVRIEIASALKRGVRVIPVLVDDASMPRSGDLPVGGPDFSGDGDKAASALLTSNRKLNGIWAVWDVPAEGVISAARSAGKDDLVITTCDLGLNVAIDMAQDGFIKGLGAQRPFDQGTTEALLAGYGLLGKQAPAYIALPALPVTRDNLLQAWKDVYHTEAPDTVKSSMQ